MDDFLPALHSFHPRPDIRELPCVSNLCDNFVALTFPQDAKIVQVHGALGAKIVVLLLLFIVSRVGGRPLGGSS